MDVHPTKNGINKLIGIDPYPDHAVQSRTNRPLGGLATAQVINIDQSNPF